MSDCCSLASKGNAGDNNDPRLKDMVFVSGGTFRMGSDHHYAEEAPSHRVTVDGFWIDATPVTNARFRTFVEATGYETFAENAPKAEDYPGALPHMLKAGSLVFRPPGRPSALAIGASGGSSDLAQIGATPTARAHGSEGWMITPSSMSLTRMPRPMRNGPERNCRPKPNGNLQRGAGSTGRVRLGRRVHARRPANGEYLARRFPHENLDSMGTSGRRPSRHFRRTAMASTT